MERRCGYPFISRVILAFFVALLLIAGVSIARAADRPSCDVSDVEHVRHIAARLNALTGPRRVEGADAIRSLNELVRDVTNTDLEHSIVWWNDLPEGMGALVLGSEGGGCHVLLVPAVAWGGVKLVILGQPI